MFSFSDAIPLIIFAIAVVILAAIFILKKMRLSIKHKEIEISFDFEK